jgi:hypothetical protein
VSERHARAEGLPPQYWQAPALHVCPCGWQLLHAVPPVPQRKSWSPSAQMPMLSVSVIKPAPALVRDSSGRPQAHDGAHAERPTCCSTRLAHTTGSPTCRNRRRQSGHRLSRLHIADPAGSRTCRGGDSRTDHSCRTCIGARRRIVSFRCSFPSRPTQGAVTSGRTPQASRRRPR